MRRLGSPPSEQDRAGNHAAVTKACLSVDPNGSSTPQHPMSALYCIRRARMMTRMKPIEFELERTIRAPIDQVFARLVDIEGHNEWMADTGSMLKRTRQTSPGEPAVGTTFIDETSQGAMPGEIVEMEPPHTIVYHWWEKSKAGKLKFEGWPSYHLRSSGDSETLVRHRGELVSYGVWRLGTPIWRRFAVKERTITIDALKASFERN